MNINKEMITDISGVNPRKCMICLSQKYISASLIVRFRTIIKQYIFTVNEIILKFVSHTIAMYEIIWYPV